MKKEKTRVHKLKLTNFDWRVVISCLNEYRKKQSAQGCDNTETCKLILRLIDETEI